LIAADRTYSPGNADPIALFLDSTMSGGTALLVGSEIDPSYSTGEYQLLKAEVIMEYERTIADLRRQLLHYKQLVAHLISQREVEPDYSGAQVVQPIDASSAKLLNSIVQARVPESAVFRDFDEEEL
jgi:hypothetical protein